MVPLLVLALLAGCSSTATEAEREQPVRFAVIAAPSLGGEDPKQGPTAEDLLLEAVTQLSGDAKVDFCLVPGPLLADAEEETRESLVSALGSLAGPVYLALGPKDAPRDELLEALDGKVHGHKGELAYWGKRVRRLRPLALAPDGAEPKQEKEQAKADRGRPRPTVVAVHAGGAKAGRYPFEVTSGEKVALVQRDGRVRLVLPSLTRPPHVFGVVTVEGGVVTLTLRSAVEGKQPPASPPPVRLP